MPIPVAPVYRQRDAFLQLLDQRAVLVVDGTTAVEMVVMLGHLEQPFARYISAAQHILQKRNDVFMFFGTAEGNYQEGVVAGHILIVGFSAAAWHSNTM